MALTREQIIKRLGRNPDPFDHRDYRIPVSPSILKVYKPPASSSVAKWASPIEDQGDEGSCVFNATTSNQELLMKKHKIPFMHLSRQFPYYNVRLVYLQNGEISSINEDCGANIRDAIMSLIKEGVPLESLWPYTSANFARKPSAKAYADALTRQLLQAFRIEGLTQMKYQIAERRSAFTTGTNVYESFERIGSDGRMPLPDTNNEELLGGHAMLVVAYNDKFVNLDKSLGAFLVQNSWGEAWGLKGRLWIPYKWMANADEVSDNWGATRGELI